MTDKELKHLRRGELLEMLLESQRQNSALKEEIEDLKKKLESREIAIRHAGSIAEASLQLNEVFAAAQRAADQYVINMGIRQEQMEKVCEKREREANEKAEATLAEALQKAQKLVGDSKDEADAIKKKSIEELEKLREESKRLKEDNERSRRKMIEESKKEISMHASQATQKLNEIIEAHEYLQGMFNTQNLGDINLDEYLNKKDE